MRFLAILAALSLFLPAASFASETQAIGSFKDITGQATIRHGGSAETVAAAAGMPIYKYDRIETGDKSHITADFADGTTIMIGPKGSLAIDEYFYDPAAPEKGRAHYKILQTAFAFIDGKLGQAKDPDVRIDLDLGWLGVRGTKIWRGMRDHQCWIYLEEGKINVNTNAGHVALLPGQTTRLSDHLVKPLEPAPWQKQDVSWIAQEIGNPP